MDSFDFTILCKKMPNKSICSEKKRGVSLNKKISTTLDKMKWLTIRDYVFLFNYFLFEIKDKAVCLVRSC